MSELLFTGQGVTKDCVVGDRQMNRYGVFNGLEAPRKIDRNLSATLLGYTVPTISSVTVVADAGDLVFNKYYAYRAVYASATHTRPVTLSDDSLNYSRGNPSAISSLKNTQNNNSIEVVVPGSTNTSVTHILLYRSLGCSTDAEAQAGPFYYVGKEENDTTGADVTITDGTDDDDVGLAVETDNFAPSAWRYAVAAFGRIFAGGNYPLGSGLTATITAGSNTVTIAGGLIYDGVSGWYFRVEDDTTGGVDGRGLYYCNRVDDTTLELIDVDGNSFNYDGTQEGTGKSFTIWLSGNVLRWSKEGEPEAFPATNLVNFESDITGLVQVPNSSLLMVCTDSPSVWILDMTLVGTASFKTSRKMISSEYTATSHYSLCGVDSRVRGIDAHVGCVWESDGVSVVDITRDFIPNIWSKLSKNENNIKLWHCAYDPRRHIFGAFVTFANAHRLIDYCVGQNTLTGGWFFNFEKDLLCSALYTDPLTGDTMVLGGIQGVPAGSEGVYGRIWTPELYSEWLPADGVHTGAVASATGNTITIDTTDGNLPVDLVGRWVLVCNANGEYTQLGYIESNTTDTLTIASVINSINPLAFSPVPEAGWSFYVGLIEMVYGPKYFDFGDPDNDKALLEVLVTMNDYDSSNLPYVRVYRGLENYYAKQNVFTQAKYRDGDTGNDTLFSRYNHLGEPAPRVGVSIVDRSYNKSAIISLTIVLQLINARNEKP